MAVMQFLEMDDFYKKKYADKSEVKTYATVDSQGNYKEIESKNYISIGNGADSYYDIGAVEDTENGAVYPVLNLSDYYSQLIVESIVNESFDDHSLEQVGLTTLDVSQILTNKLLYQEDYGLPISGMPALKIEEVFKNEDRNLAEIIKDPNTDSPFKVMADKYFVHDTTTFPTKDEFDEFKKMWVASSESNALAYLNNFRDDFGPFRSAVNKSIKELAEPYKMNEMLKEYREVFQKNFDINNDEELSKQIALKTVLGGEIETRLGEQDVIVPDFMRGNMLDLWMDYNLGITTPELNLQAMMFHNDGFRKIIDSFNEYLYTDEQFKATNPKPWGMNLTYDDYKNAETYHQQLNHGINDLLLKLNSGTPTKDEKVLQGQKVAVQSYLLRDAINQTHTYAKKGYAPFWSPFAWWFIPSGARTAYRGYQSALMENFMSNFVKPGELNKENAYDWFDPKYKGPKKTWGQWIKSGGKGLAKRGLGSMGFAMMVAEAGPDIVRDLGGMMFGGEKSVEYPKSYYGRTLFNSFGFQPDEGERGSEQKPLESLGEFYYSLIFGPQGGESSYGNIHTDMKNIYKNVSSVIVNSHNDVLTSSQFLNTAGLKITSDIQNSNEFKNITDDSEKRDYFLKQWYLKAFNGGDYQLNLGRYVQAHNTFEGALNLMGRVSISGEDANNIILRQVPKPESFPQELWDDLISISNMSKDDYTGKYGNKSKEMLRSVEGFNEGYKNQKDFDSNYYSIKNFLKETLENVSFLPNMEDIQKDLFPDSDRYLLLEDDRFSIYPYTHPTYGGTFNPLAFKEVQTNANSIYNLPELRESLKTVNGLLKVNQLNEEDL